MTPSDPENKLIEPKEIRNMMEVHFLWMDKISQGITLLQWLLLIIFIAVIIF